jgi:hypothetical protein
MLRSELILRNSVARFAEAREAPAARSRISG